MTAVAGFGVECSPEAVVLRHAEFDRAMREEVGRQLSAAQHSRHRDPQVAQQRLHARLQVEAVTGHAVILRAGSSQVLAYSVNQLAFCAMSCVA